MDRKAKADELERLRRGRGRRTGTVEQGDTCTCSPCRQMLGAAAEGRRPIQCNTGQHRASRQTRVPVGGWGEAVLAFPWVGWLGLLMVVVGTAAVRRPTRRSTRLRIADSVSSLLTSLSRATRPTRIPSRFAATVSPHRATTQGSGPFCLACAGGWNARSLALGRHRPLRALDSSPVEEEQSLAEDAQGRHGP